MLFAALLAAAVQSPLVEGLPPEVASLAEEASGWLLEGRALPPDYRVRLMRLTPAERLQAIIFLRRAGLLSDAPWPLEDILRPADPSEGKPE